MQVLKLLNKACIKQNLLLLNNMALSGLEFFNFILTRKDRAKCMWSVTRQSQC